MVVVTAKDLTPDDRQRLNGYVEQILQKGAYSREELLREVRDLVAVRVQPGRSGTGEDPDGEDPAGGVVQKPVRLSSRGNGMRDKTMPYFWRISAVTVVTASSLTVTSCVTVPRLSCQSWRVYLPGGTLPSTNSPWSFVTA